MQDRPARRWSAGPRRAGRGGEGGATSRTPLARRTPPACPLYASAGRAVCNVDYMNARAATIGPAMSLEIRTVEPDELAGYVRSFGMGFGEHIDDDEVSWLIETLGHCNCRAAFEDGSVVATSMDER